MTRTQSTLVVLAAGLGVLLTGLTAAGAEFAERDGGWRITGKTYAAEIDASGNFRSLVVAGTEFLGAGTPRGKKGVEEQIGGDFPGGNASSVTREGDAIVATAKQGATVRYTFDDDGFTAESTGGTVEWYLSKAVTACVGKAGVSGTDTGMGDVYKVVAGNAAVAVDQPYHIMWGRLMPSILTRGGQAAAPFRCRWTCGVEVRTVELITLSAPTPAGKDHRFTAEYAPGEAARIDVALTSFAAEDAAVELAFRVVDHPVKGQTVFEKTLPVTVPAGKAATSGIEVPLETPGLYWVHVELRSEGKTLLAQRVGVLYDRDNYRPALTRPDDFKAFWDAKLAAMREIPFDAKLIENAAASNDDFTHWDLEIAGHDGKRVRSFVRVPRGEGPFDAEVHSYWGSTPPDKVMGGLAKLEKLEKQPVGAGMWERGEKRIRVGAPQPDDSTYTRWNGRDDNNLLDSYLTQVRFADYLRSREDVKRIWLFGASRSGASMLAAAALSPERVAAVNVHVPTSCGLSWSEKPYRGWGKPPASTPEGLATAAYFDPVNFAPDLVVPVVMDGGFYDDLAPAPGILAFYNHAAKAPFRRCAINQGGHGYFTGSHRKDFEAELAEFLGMNREQ